MQTDVSYGCIPVRNMNDQWEVLLVMKANGQDGRQWWGLPKGHAEPNESPVAAATRELFEETGIADAAIDEQVSYTDTYTFERDGETVDKKVIYFLCRVPETEPVGIDRVEIVDYRFAPFPEAIELATYDGMKKMLREVAQKMGVVHVGK